MYYERFISLTASVAKGYEGVTLLLLAIDDFGECVWEQVAADRNKWKKELHQGLQTGETKLQQEAIDKRTRRKIRQTTRPIKPPAFYSHSRGCSSTN